MGSRRKGREFALQLLFQEDVAQTPPEEIRRLFWASNQTDEETRGFAELLFHKFLESQLQVDQLIRRHARNWSLERMAAVDRNILRMAASELLFTETPAAVVIDEAIDIARKYSGEDSPDFVNGVLDAVKEELQHQAPAGPS
ncbi:MAG: transcription antitermination factor NusB [Acidobacteriota bacterium]